MASIFPSSPGANQIYTASDGSRWQWDGRRWRGRGGGEDAVQTRLSAITNWTPTPPNVQYALAELHQMLIGNMTFLTGPDGSVLTDEAGNPLFVQH